MILKSGVADSSLVAQLQSLFQPGDTLWWGQATAEPLTLTRAVVQHRHALAQGGRLRVFVGIGASDTLQPGLADAIDFFGYAAGGPHRALAQAGVLDILPSHYSHLPGLIRAGVLPVDVVLLQVSPTDAQGRYSLGLVQEYLPAAIERARVVIAEVHPDVPWTHGGLHLQAVDPVGGGHFVGGGVGHVAREPHGHGHQQGRDQQHEHACGERVGFVFHGLLSFFAVTGAQQLHCTLAALAQEEVADEG